MKPNTPTRAQLYERIAYLEKQNARLIEERDAAKQFEWSFRIGQARDFCIKELSAVYPNTLGCVSFTRVDLSGYWFTYQVTSIPNTTHIYCVRHSDLNNPINKEV